MKREVNIASKFGHTGAFKIYKPLPLTLLSLLVVIIGVGMAKSMLTGALAVGTVLLLALIGKIRKQPIFALYGLFIFSFFAIGLTRLIPLPLGLAIDFLILLTWCVIFFQQFKKLNLSKAKNGLTYSFGIWALYCILEIFNPLAPSMMAWFYAIRGLALYGILLVPLIFLFFDSPKHFKKIINIWFAISILMGLYGAKQFWIGPFGFEQRWLDEGGHVTHVLWGVFSRMFSFASDANQFGCSQAHAGIVATIFLAYKTTWKERIFYASTALICFYGMFISGTRGAIVIPIIGFMVYLGLSKNFKAIIVGGLIGGVAIYILAFTHMFHGIEAVRRMRTTFNATEDESFIVRMENRARLETYMSDKPFGGGIGTAGVWGQRFSPNTFLANFETDGHYVRIYAETGKVGISLYYIIMAYIIGKSCWICWNLKSKYWRNRIIAITAGFLGIMVVNYSAAIIIGLPSSAITYWCLAFIFMSPKWDQQEISQRHA